MLCEQSADYVGTQVIVSRVWEEMAGRRSEERERASDQRRRSCLRAGSRTPGSVEGEQT